MPYAAQVMNDDEQACMDDSNTRITSNVVRDFNRVGDNMTRALAIIGAFAPMCICFGFAGYMVVHGVNGWGWFLFVGICCAGSVKFKGD